MMKGPETHNRSAAIGNLNKFLFVEGRKSVGRMGLNSKRASVFFSVYQSHFLEAAMPPNALFKTLLSLALGAVCGGGWGRGTPLSHRGLPPSTGDP